ncbi:MAG: FAD:protein FMN transferase [Candidatus Anammoximicrobium sp.]|nr:FAD:protein FMN transferase [Candidatus Anammoximicrobium sp.]
MGTQYTVRIAEPPDGVGLPLLKHRITSRLDAINRQMSTYLPESEISRFNRVESPDWFPVSADVVRVVAAALEVSRSTAGAFDVTVGPLVNLWGFGPAGRSATVPAAEAVAACRSRVGYGLLQVRADPPALRKRRADVHVDLSAIAKGFAVDEVARILERHRVRGYLIEIGGEVRTCGRKSDGGLWRVGIERPVVDGRAIACVIELEGQSLATSGDYRNYFEQQGRRYSHAIDPRTGRPVEHGLVSVSVLASDCMTADAWATALMVLGPEAALPMARRHGLDVLCMIRTTAGVVERTTPGFAARITGSASSGGEPPIGAGSEARR